MLTLILKHKMHWTQDKSCGYLQCSAIIITTLQRYHGSRLIKEYVPAIMCTDSHDTRIVNWPLEKNLYPISPPMTHKDNAHFCSNDSNTMDAVTSSRQELLWRIEYFPIANVLLINLFLIIACMNRKPIKHFNLCFYTSRVSDYLYIIYMQHILSTLESWWCIIVQRCTWEYWIVQMPIAWGI